MEGKGKKILFVLPTAQIGGTRTALLNLLSHMDKEAYEIDLVLLRHIGGMLEQFKSACNLLPQDEILLAGRESGAALLKKAKLAALVRRVSLTAKAKKQGLSRYDLSYRLAAQKLSGKYDCVIAFQEKDATEFAQYIEAPRKIAWVHTDFSRAVRSSSEERVSSVSNQFHKVVFVSDACMNEFKEKSHIDHSKMERIYNTFDSEQIVAKSTAYTLEAEKVPTFVSVGRFCEQKSFERVTEVALRLKTEGYSFKWYVVGDGELFDQIKGQVDENNLADCVILTGRKSNPYPYIKNADAMVITSVFESHPMVANEALILGTPVVSAGFPAAAESVKDMQNGLLCDNSAEGVYQGVKRILDDSALLASLTDAVKDFVYDNSQIIKQIEDIIEGRI